MSQTPPVLLTLQEKIKDRTAMVGVVGLGYVGLPFAVEKAKVGFRVLGIEQNPRRAQQVNQGDNYIGDVQDEELKQVVSSGHLQAVSSFDRVAEMDVIVICVPTPLTKNLTPNLSYIESVTEQISERLRPGQLVTLESTTYPGTTDEVMRPLLEKTSGLQQGQDFFLAHSPERVDPGNQRYTTKNTNKVVGASDPHSLAVATLFYEQTIETVVPVSSAKAAELVKVFENTFRAVNIALVNELALLCDRLELNVWEVLDAANTKPFGIMPFYPGPGVGGHCLVGTEQVRYRWYQDNGVIALEALYQRVQERSERVFYHLGGAFLRPEGLEVLSIDLETGEQGWKPVSYLFAREYEGTLVKVETSDRRQLTVTDRHPMLVHEADRLQVREAIALTPGDMVPLVHQATADDLEEPESIEVIPLLPEQLAQKVRVKHPQGWEELKDYLKPLLHEKTRDVLRDNSLPSSTWKKLPDHLRGNPEQFSLVTGRGPSFSSFPAVIPVNESLARLLGYYLSEGCITEEKTGNLRMRFTFNRDEREYLQDVRDLLSELGLSCSEYNDPQWHSTTLKVKGWLLAWFFRDILRTGTDAYTMRIPDPIMAGGEAIRTEVLKGLFRGDGDVHVRCGQQTYRTNGVVQTYENNSGTVGFFSSSPELFEQVILLLQELGLTPYRKKDKPQLRFKSHRDLDRLESWFLGEKAQKLARLRLSRKRHLASKRPQVNQLYAVAQIHSVTPFAAKTPVYSVEVAETHTFAATTGVYVHNCIPLDPHYLEWKAKEHNFETHFIALAGEVNRKMPEFVREKVGRVLNRIGKAPSRSQVLVIGAAYKKDISDWRESPAIAIMELLLKDGVNLTYHDPYVPEIQVSGHHLESVELTQGAIGDVDLVIIATDHSKIDYLDVVEKAQAVLDTRGVTRHLRCNQEKVTLL
ncbi:nucleotide sugar dehydrogenase [Oscillatoria sp. HE19RPO]|uniref:nucleotide sugar dehydrogenase n=1 Tax=Oscillatoria sp. HE19RPO TaxID=2954806 RepID=UPI0020C21C0A|nr:nucleotide sugar dehydrogenase [Oscillatoria sp. HE19RPO]